MVWISVRDFEDVLDEFKSEIKKARELKELDGLESGWLWWDDVHLQYVYLRVIVDDGEGEGRLVWVGNGRTAYDGSFTIECVDDLLDILENIDEYFDFEVKS